MGTAVVKYFHIQQKVLGLCNAFQKLKKYNMKKLNEKSIEYVRKNYRFQTNDELMRGAGITRSNLVYIFRVYKLKRTKHELWKLRMKHKKVTPVNGDLPHWKKRDYQPFDFI